MRPCPPTSTASSTSPVGWPSSRGTTRPASPPVTDWNFADVWDAVAATVPDRPALQQGGVRIDWRDFERRAAAAAGYLVAPAAQDSGLGHQAKVAQYLYNCPEYLEALYA